jgi:hypothetical protein
VRSELAVLGLSGFAVLGLSELPVLAVSGFAVVGVAELAVLAVSELAVLAVSELAVLGMAELTVLGMAELAMPAVLGMLAPRATAMAASGHVPMAVLAALVGEAVAAVGLLAVSRHVGATPGMALLPLMAGRTMLGLGFTRARMLFCGPMLGRRGLLHLRFLCGLLCIGALSAPHQPGHRRDKPPAQPQQHQTGQNTPSHKESS